MIPAAPTAVAVNKLAPTIISIRNCIRLSPSDCDAESPKRKASIWRASPQSKRNPKGAATHVTRTTLQSLPANEPINQDKITIAFWSLRNINNDTIALVMLLIAIPASSKVSADACRPSDPTTKTTRTIATEPSIGPITDAPRPPSESFTPATTTKVAPKAAPLDAPITYGSANTFRNSP